MILTALSQYYDRLADNPDPYTEQDIVPPFGFSEEKISYILVLSKQGKVVDMVPHIEIKGKKTVAKSMFVPASFKRSGKYTEKAFDSGKENAFFLWDKTAYALGLDANKDKKADIRWVESPVTFQSFKRFHLNALENINDEGLEALRLFLERWQPRQFDTQINKPEILGANIAFQLDGEHSYLHQSPAAITLWKKLFENSLISEENTCLVTGKQAKITRLHPAIKNVFGGQSSGGSIVTFNADSYESYGKKQGDNAPVSELAAFKYTTALNYLLNRDNKHCFSVGDASTVFWAMANNSDQSACAEQFFSDSISPTDDNQAAEIRPKIEQISKGRPLQEIMPNIDPDSRFYVLGLAPNAARLSIRYWLDTNFGALANHLAKHYGDLSLTPTPWSTPPSIWRLLMELAPYRSGKKIKSSDIPSHLAGELMRSILTGDRYPRSLLVQVVLRIRTDGHLSSLRIAIIKAVLNRDYRKRLIKEEVPMSLDENNENCAYQLGRLFAVLERIQSVAINKANATITDRYFATASTVPYSVFPRLLAGSKNHLSKVRKRAPGYAVNLDKDMTQIIGKLPPSFPKHSSIENQGRFTIGYYHQREKYFTSNKSESSQTATNAD